MTVGIIALIVVIICCVVAIPRIQSTIRAREIDSIVINQFDSDKVKAVPQKNSISWLDDKGEATVVFSKPSGSVFNSFVSLMNAKNSKNVLDHNLYVYPLVYNQKEIANRFKLTNGNVLTIIYFRTGEEYNRIELTASSSFTSDLLTNINHISSPSVLDGGTKSNSKNNQSSSSETTSSSTSTSSTTTEEPQANN
jgi:hypothetical protein